MAGSFANKGGGSDGGAKRPAPTIEGTATDVTEEKKAETAASEPEAEPSESAEPKEIGDAAEAEDPSDEAPADEEDEAADETAALPPPEAKPEPSRRGSRVGAVVANLTAGLLGGLVGAGALALAWGYLPGNRTAEAPDLSPLEDRIAKLEEAPPAPDNSAELAKLESRLSALESKTPETPPEVAALADRVTQLETSLKAMADAAKDGGSVADAAVISQQISEAESRLDAKLDKALSDMKAENTAALDAVKKEVAALDAKLKALAEASFSGSDDSQLGAQLEGLDDRIGKIESALPSLIDAMDADAEGAKAATLAIAFANLRAAVMEGRPYETELATLSALSPGNGDLGALLDYEDTGIPTLPELTRRFKAAREAALSTPASGDEGSFFDQLLASAASLVKVTRVDAEAEGDTSGAILARAEAKLDKGDLAAAVKEVETLKGAPREAFDTWLDAAQARLGADATLQKLQSIMLVSLNENAGSAGPPEQTDKQD